MQIDPVTTVPSSATPTLQSLVYTLLRAVMLALGAVGVGVGANINDGALMVIAGALVTIGTAAWSLWDQVRTARHAHATAVASAVAQTPVQPKP